MSEISKERVEALASNILECHDVKPSEVKALAGLALLALRERAEPEFYGPYTPVMVGAGVWVSIADELPPHLDGRKVWVTTSPTAPPAPVVPDDYFASLVTAARARAEKAMRKFPQPNYVLNKVAEESGEVIKAVIHYTEGRETWQNVETEIIDNLAMLIRLVVEGDGVIGFTPPDACRAAMLAAAPQREAKNV
ncbi:hypothetical protein ACULV5_001983 [Cronobacter dublinensis]